MIIAFLDFKIVYKTQIDKLYLYRTYFFDGNSVKWTFCLRAEGESRFKVSLLMNTFVIGHGCTAKHLKLRYSGK